jgi:hypothetical protein
MTGIWWTSVSIEIFLCSVTAATTAHLLMSLCQTLFHRYLGHRGIGGRFFENHLYIHRSNYSGDHVVSKHYLHKEANNTPFFLITATLGIGLGYLVLPLDLFIVQLTACRSRSICTSISINTTTWRDHGWDDLPGSGESNSSISSTTGMPIAILR